MILNLDAVTVERINQLCMFREMSAEEVVGNAILAVYKTMFLDIEKQWADHGKAVES